MDGASQCRSRSTLQTVGSKAARKRHSHIFVAPLLQPANSSAYPNANSQIIPLPDGDAGTGVTVEHMIALVESGKKDQTVIRTAGQIVRSVPQFNRAAEASAVFQWVRRNIRFTSDVKGVETLRSPAETIAAGVGDCDDYVILICALLSAIGHSMRIVTVASDPRDPSVFTHVFPEDYIRGNWLALDAARRNPAIGKRPSRIFRVRVWQMDGGYQDLDPNDYLRGGSSSSSGGDARALQGPPTSAVSGAWGIRSRAFAGLGYLGQDDADSILTALTPDITAATTGAANIIRATQGQAPYAVGPGGVPVQQTAYAPASSASQYMPLLLIGGLLVAVMVMRK